ncbi:hypothetical protein KP509_1Z015100 [Ceratopteris richardii]|nr:hypothetical protein KP509_1Z015100 [Ceratopteris richardii]
MEKVSIKVMDMLMDMLPELQEKAYPQSATAAGGLARMSANRSKAKAGIEKMVGDKRNNSIVRLNYYPPCPQPNLTLGLGVHSDPHLLTLLHQDLVGGLQVFKDGVWTAVRPRPNALIVNIGDALQVTSNDIYKSVEHRAVCNSLKSRLSMGFFLTPLDDATISPFASSSSRYRPFTWKEYREQMYANRPRGRSNLLHYRIQNS